MLLRAERRAIPPARRPGAFQERSVRVFVIDERWEEAARAALRVHKGDHRGAYPWEHVRHDRFNRCSHPRIVLLRLARAERTAA